jgi:hypothetical protein
MCLPAPLIDRLVGVAAPVLCVDTCTLLDVVRDITRDSVRPADAAAGLRLLSAAEDGGQLAVLLAEQVRQELLTNVEGVQAEAQKALARFKEQVKRMGDVAALFGGNGSILTEPIENHVARARSVLDRWLAVGRDVPHDDTVTGKAFARVNEPRTPARRGKESMKDCVIVETYLDAARRLRAAGLRAAIVFASSNTNDYCGAGSSRLANDLARDFDAVGIEYAPGFSAAAYCLGVRR